MRKRWPRVVLAALVLVSFGVCLVHADDEAEDHALAPHACAAMLMPALSATALMAPMAGPSIKIESPSRPQPASLQPFDPPPEASALA